ncbi:MAG: hypothetical protein RL722_38 [Pseudomonadota bacterium]|jgi:hypothetical protein
MSTRVKGGKGAKVAPKVTAFEHAAYAAGLPVQSGKGAINTQYQKLVCARSKGARFTGSVDMDAAYKATEAASSRWDFGLGLRDVGQAEVAVWVEPHSATSQKEVDVVLAKLAWLKAKLDLPTYKQLRELTAAAGRQKKRPFIWLASGAVGFRAGSPAANRLVAAGMAMPQTYVEL